MTREHDQASSSGACLPSLHDILWDLECVYAVTVRKSGAIVHPQVVAAISAECSSKYVELLFDADPAIGSVVIYGTLLLRGTQYFLDAVDDASDMILFSTRASRPETQLLIHAVDRALAIRDLSTLEGEFIPERVSRFHSIREGCGAECNVGGREEIEDRFPGFSRLRVAIDVLYKSASAGFDPDGTFFTSTEPTVGNYLKAAFGSLSLADSPTQKAALDYFQRLDPTLHGMFQFGLRGHYRSNKGPTRLRCTTVNHKTSDDESGHRAPPHSPGRDGGTSV
jgi:hypothetical protein